MSWETRLHEMILAGGALAVAACGASAQGSSTFSPDATSERGPSDAAPAGEEPDFCCNANPDPCCEYQYCGAALTPACASELACRADGGTWVEYPPGCSLGDEAGPGDGGGDAPDDGPADAPFDASQSGGGPCGPTLTCKLGTMCVDARHEGADGGSPTLYSCAPYPASCGDAPACACAGSLCPAGYTCAGVSGKILECM